MKLRSLLSRLPKALVSGSLDTEVESVTSDSRNVVAGALFVALSGSHVDGHEFIESAIADGASVIVAEKAPSEAQMAKVVWVHVNDSKNAYAAICSAFFGDPSERLDVIGITGTNGKSTTGFLAQHILRTVQHRAGLIGTVISDDGESRKSAKLTTPDALELHETFARMLDNGCKSVAMEVSSIGVDQQRVAHTKFAAGIFTNFTQDHLDYHKTMERYFEAKLAFFEQMASQEGSRKPAAIINIDDPYGRELAKMLADKLFVVTYGMGIAADFKASQPKQTARYTEFQLENGSKSYLVRMPLIGRFNVYNALGAIAAVASTGVKIRDCVQAMADAPQVPGRVELAGQFDGTTVFVDYAHTPDALETVCKMLKDLEPTRLITVFGCGGDRDVTKRPLMGRAASSLSDITIITSDNPRSEDPEKIIAQVRAGAVGKNHHAIVDRAEAIKTAILIAKGGDIVLIAGKGHEDYQEFATGRVAFDDRVMARRYIAEETKERFQKREEKKIEAEERRMQRRREEREDNRGE